MHSLSATVASGRMCYLCECFYSPGLSLLTLLTNGTRRFEGQSGLLKKRCAGRRQRVQEVRWRWRLLRLLRRGRLVADAALTSDAVQIHIVRRQLDSWSLSTYRPAPS